jgi:hypothetical protein
VTASKLLSIKLNKMFKQIILNLIMVSTNETGVSPPVFSIKKIPTYPGWQSLTLHFHCPAATSSDSTSPLPVPSTSRELPAFLFFC